MGALDRLRVVVVDDEPPARDRMVALVAQCGARAVAALDDSQDALRWLERHPADVLLLDISMPGMNGLELAQKLRTQPLVPQVVFTTAHENHAVDAFELDAVDYLLKPVRLERLRQALERAARRCGEAPAPEPHFSVRHRDRMLLVPFSDVRYLKAELKYVTLVTASDEYLLDESLTSLESRLPDIVLRIHRNCLVMRHAVLRIERIGPPQDEQWMVFLRDMPQPLPVSRRQLSALRMALQTSS